MISPTSRRVFEYAPISEGLAVARLANGMVVTTIAGGMVIALAGPVLAEGSWSSSMSNVKGGSESRRWTDRQNDGNHTKIKLVNPQTEGNQPKAIALTLYGDRSARPDVNLGKKGFAGGATTTQDWGTPSHRGNFHFTVATIAGFNLGWWVDSVTVSY